MSVEGDLKSTLKTNSTNDQIWNENGNNGYDNVNNIMESNRYNCGSDIHCINECNEVFSLGCIITGTNIASPPPMHLPPLILSDAKLKGGKITLPPLLLSM
ncbi:hypothetical protein TRFO_34658 [Tritrichomonas foetus]|uniref:Uncharacterized protein n=1 Tax=Tritrichomonas foetus TaxID=1144522 RepID=A0A1J4JIK0_9EUKA|nr:hypothetical protein TRFO_34658 [Tritrichomonas foetus]|eukprot:OHS98970.1 hypothetical protein TRFO_34658 [Tritrichomonas foetus]